MAGSFTKFFVGGKFPEVFCWRVVSRNIPVMEILLKLLMASPGELILGSTAGGQENRFRDVAMNAW